MFSELYGAYYNTMAKLLELAVKGGLDKSSMQRVIEKYAFSDSLFQISSAVSEERWQLIRSDFSTPIEHVSTMPLTRLQMQWLKSLTLDRRFRLFGVEIPWLEDTPPLFTDEDHLIFDSYSDGDPFDDEEYIKNFRLILDAVQNKYPLTVVMNSKHGRALRMNVMPHHLEYSEKDDKFRLITLSNGCSGMINLGRLIHCERYYGKNISPVSKTPKLQKELTLEVTDGRNALERVMLHFAHFEKRAKRLDSGRYSVTLRYSSEDETEILIRVLSFGKFVKVIEPQDFIELIKERLKKQKSLFAGFFP